MLRVIVVMKELKNRRVHGVFTQLYFVIRVRVRWFEEEMQREMVLRVATWVYD